MLETLIQNAPAPAPGQRTPATIAALAARDAALREAAVRFGLGARALANRLARYEATAWPNDRTATECPARHTGKLEELFWRALKAVPRSIGERQMRDVVGSELPQFIAGDLCQPDDWKEPDDASNLQPQQRRHRTAR